MRNLTSGSVEFASDGRRDRPDCLEVGGEGKLGEVGKWLKPTAEYERWRGYWYVSSACSVGLTAERI